MVFPIKGPAAHQTFPLTSQALTWSSLTPEFNYSDIFNARIINDRLWPSLESFSPAEFTIIGLIGRSYLRLIENYIETSCPSLYSDLDTFLPGLQDLYPANKFLNRFLVIYPTTLVYYTPRLVSKYYLSDQGAPENRYSIYNSLLLVYAAGINPAIRKKDNIFTDPIFINSPEYQYIIKSLIDHFETQPLSLKSGNNLLDLLAAPSNAHPDSLEAQLNYIRSKWGELLGQSFINELIRSQDLLREENKPSFTGHSPVENPLDFYGSIDHSDQAQSRFTPDKDWMPNLVLIAKNIFVWLDQLSIKYQRTISQLDQIPDEELFLLSSWGITGLWLIGLWERSSASQKIKQFCGNSDAIPSAYSLFDYSIAKVLGGEAAYQNLSDRALCHKIRLAADMVPNHMGINSSWIIDHPERFLALEKSPFPAYSFSGPNLSEDHQIGIYLEDHYYNQTDAAVVFKRIDHQSGHESYVYHGNDGTAMPWNDTAQLDFLNPETREAVIQSILHVARKFPIIRFDAAMTLAKLHFQRLWYPIPGTGGAIPTRSEHGLSKEQFDAAMPHEFWQEVVDRVAQEAPDTLLLAEAFWMMEGYFVRTLGMHRVYNSAFMHMLRDENNQKYRDLIIKTLEFDPQILKRYVNFMNNPDEESALSQFGSDGKYFGICVLLSTLPGLPMFGHGQIEGYSEKYGMEYQRAYYDEKPNRELVDRHSREIFPLLKKRYLFAGVENFYLLDVISVYGRINHDVIAYTNHKGSEHALVVFHNKWSHAEGTIQYSSPINGRSIPLLDTLGIIDNTADYLLFRDLITGLEYIRSVDALKSRGLTISLGAYQYQIYLDFKLVNSEEEPYQQLHQSLQNSGTPSLQDDLFDIKFDPILSSLINMVKPFQDSEPDDTGIATPDSGSIPFSPASHYDLLNSLFTSLSDSFPGLTEWNLESKAAHFTIMQNGFAGDEIISSLLTGLVFYEIFNDCCKDFPEYFLSVLSRLLDKRLNRSNLVFKTETWIYFRLLQEIYSNITELSADPVQLTNFWFQNQVSKDFINIHSYQDQLWFDKEAFEEIVDLTFMMILLYHRPPTRKDIKSLQTDTKIADVRKLILDLLPRSNFLVDNFTQLAVYTAED